ncbi:hypothetical protein EXIGLDRAFT_782656 [Exidia glandulosa HHB12029]|uniref:Uncharacterized protein n=1 Tax=Exidia glandulosa HHB12029 TaxID=1314781 RepID=A0A166NIF3_EXIGL|nr:hypothetical protein EXIGLDRAFT_782656 [Exidia glandulosa HHB12029]
MLTDATGSPYRAGTGTNEQLGKIVTSRLRQLRREPERDYATAALSQVFARRCADHSLSDAPFTGCTGYVFLAKVIRRQSPADRG